jgi:flavin-dependent dehydrogenase
MGVDPLSGSGLVRALLTGEAAGTAIAHWLVGRREPADAYERWLDARFAEYWSERAAYYSLERRWPDAPFWSRRVPNASG